MNVSDYSKKRVFDKTKWVTIILHDKKKPEEYVALAKHVRHGFGDCCYGMVHQVCCPFSVPHYFTK